MRDSIAIFSARETPPTLVSTIEAAVRAIGPAGVVDVVVNGNRGLANETVHATAGFGGLCEECAVGLRVWFVKCADKAHAWNSYLHEIWPVSEVAFFLDGYARVRANACALLRAALLARPDVMAGTGVPSSGRTASRLAAQMRQEGGIHGNFYAIKHETMRALQQRGYRLPLGIYRTDPTLGAMINFRLDPSCNSWDPTQVLVHPEATWDTDEKVWWRPAEWKSQYKRILRQGQGVLENLAVRDHLAIRKQPPETMPETAAELVLEWAARCPDDARRAARLSFPVAHALRQLALPRDWSERSAPAELLASVRCNQEYGA